MRSPASDEPSDAGGAARGGVRSVARAAFDRIEAAFDAAFPPRANPWRTLGGLAWILFWIAAVSGIYVYVLFDTRADGAWASVERMSANAWPGSALARSLHRYASDAFILVTMLHLAREWAHGRYAHVHRYAWITGVALVAFVYGSGLVGFWLVWDRLAQYSIVATTEWLDVLPIFAEPLAGNFDANARIDDRLFSLLISGLGLAFWLGLRGEVVIHGSATADSDGQAVLLVGPTGAGKSTLSALLCACGRQLIADDAVRLERTHRGWVVHGGVREVRLRSGATSAKRLFDGARSRESVDGRCALELQTAPPGATSLRHVAFPRITAASEPCSRLIPAATALVELLRGLRFGAWGPGEVLAKQTRALADLAREVPAYEVVLPRSERFDDERANHTHRWLVQLGMADDEAPRELCRSS